MFYNAQVTLSCQYQRASSLVPPITPPIVDPMVLESMTIDLSARSHNPDLVDFSSTHIIRLLPDNQIKDNSSEFSGFSFSQPQSGGERRVFGTIYSENIKPSTAITYDSSEH